MGFFGKILNVFGFYSDEELKNLESPKEKQQKHKPTKQKNNEFVLKDKNKKENISEFFPQTQQEIFDIVEFLKTGADVKLDLSNFEGEDLTRATDFLQGVCTALGIEPIFENNKILLKH